MIVMMTITPARVNPRSPSLPGSVWRAIESGAGSGAMNVVNAGRGDLRAVSAGVERCGIVGIGRLLHFFPIRAPGHGVFRNFAKVVILLQRLQALGILLLVGVEVVDCFAHLEEVVAQC